MKDFKAMRTEIAHLRTLAAASTDARVIVEIEKMIRELEQQIKGDTNGSKWPSREARGTLSPSPG